MEDYLPPKEHTSGPGSSPRCSAETSDSDQKQSDEHDQQAQLANGSASLMDILNMWESKQQSEQKNPQKHIGVTNEQNECVHLADLMAILLKAGFKLKVTIEKQTDSDESTPELLVELSQVQGQWSKQDLLCIAENSDTPINVLAWLAKHEDVDVRTTVADNPNTPLDLLMSLSKDECVDVRYAIAENHNAPHTVLRILVFDDNPYVASRAQKTINRVAGGSIVSAKFGTNVYISRSRWQA